MQRPVACCVCRCSALNVKKPKTIIAEPHVGLTHLCPDSNIEARVSETLLGILTIKPPCFASILTL